MRKHLWQRQLRRAVAACADEDEHELLLPVTNSPRMGVCAYEGQQDRYGYIPLKLIKDEKE